MHVRAARYQRSRSRQIAAFNAAEEWDFVEQSSTFMDMQNTGHLSLIADLDLRLTLARYYREMLIRRRFWSLPDDYRSAARGIIPNDFQQALHERCTSILSTDPTDSAQLWEIDWVDTEADTDCLGDLSHFKLAAAANRLREHPQLVEMLRYRMSEARVAVMLFKGQRAAANALRERLIASG